MLGLNEVVCCRENYSRKNLSSSLTQLLTYFKLFIENIPFRVIVDFNWKSFRANAGFPRSPHLLRALVVPYQLNQKHSVEGMKSLSWNAEKKVKLVLNHDFADTLLNIWLLLNQLRFATHLSVRSSAVLLAITILLSPRRHLRRVLAFGNVS